MAQDPKSVEAVQTTPLRLGLVGFGRLAQEYYVPAFRYLTTARLVGIADPLAASRAAAERLLPETVTHADHRALLSSPGLDGVLVASPPSTHLDVWQLAVERLLPVFMEKPFVLDGQLERATPSAAARRLLMVNFNRRFWPEYQRLRALVQSGAIGRPAAAEFILQTDVLSWSSITRHRLSPSEGGVLYDLGSQVLDLAMTVFGQEPVSIDARIHTERWEADHVRLSLELAGGTAVHCSLAYTDHNRECAVIRGAAGTARLRDPNMAVHLERVSSSMRSLVGLCRDAAVLGYRALRRDHSMLRFSVRSALETFVRALHAGQPFSPGFDDAERNLRWLEAARRSAASGRPEALVARAREKQQVRR